MLVCDDALLYTSDEIGVLRKVVVATFVLLIMNEKHGTWLGHSQLFDSIV